MSTPISGKSGTLYICGTPIGNLEDITLRALRILKEVDYIAAEDTRHTLKLLNHFNISKPLISYHEHNKREKGKDIISMLEAGQDIALVSDAGMPGISDPGADMVVLAYEHKVPVTIVPGPSASVSALVLSGLSTERFVFEGFIPGGKKERKERLSSLKNEERTIILYEAPHHLMELLRDLLIVLGDRKITIVRELTKIHEEVLQMTINEAIVYYTVTPPKGEFVLIIEGALPAIYEKNFDNLNIQDHLIEYMKMGLGKKEAVKQVAKDRGIPKNEVYPYSIGIEGKL